MLIREMFKYQTKACYELKNVTFYHQVVAVWKSASPGTLPRVPREPRSRLVPTAAAPDVAQHNNVYFTLPTTFCIYILIII